MPDFITLEGKKRGDTIDISGVFTPPSVKSQDIENYTIACQFKLEGAGTPVTAAANILNSDGDYLVTLEPAITRDMAIGDWYFDVQFTSPDGLYVESSETTIQPITEDITIL